LTDCLAPEGDILAERSWIPFDLRQASSSNFGQEANSWKIGFRE